MKRAVRILKQLQRRWWPTPSVILSGVALFVVLGGSAVAATGLIHAGDIAPGAVTGKAIRSGAVEPKDLSASTRALLTDAGGAQGEAGAAGKAGSAGADGAKGTSGTNGVLAPEDLVGDAPRHPVAERFSRRALGGGIGRAAGWGVVEEPVRSAPEDLFLGVAEQLQGGRVRIPQPAVEVAAEDPLAGRVDDPLVVLGEAVVFAHRQQQPDQDQARDQRGEHDPGPRASP